MNRLRAAALALAGALAFAFATSVNAQLPPRRTKAPPATVQKKTPPSPPAPSRPAAPFREPDMVIVPAGSFTMGSPASEAGRESDEGPQRTVSVRSFAVGKYEVTFDEWAACASGGGCRSNPNPNDAGFGRGRHPVINVSWNDAKEYVAWLSSRTGKSYRLLTEAEWEYAARAGTTGPWSWGADPNAACSYANLWSRSEASDSPATCSDGSGPKTVDVGRFSPNGFGLYDMHGNVWEWVEDCYTSSYAGLATDGSANANGDCSNRVGRGGSWINIPQYLRSANRNRNTPTFRGIYLGFRVARTP